jgi:hypothetical protein
MKIPQAIFPLTLRTFLFVLLSGFLFEAPPDARAADCCATPSTGHDFHPVPEYISPVTLAYERLKSLLGVHGNPKAIPFVFPAVERALSNPLSLPALTRELTDQMVDGECDSEGRDMAPQRVLENFISMAYRIFSTTREENEPMKIPFGDLKLTLSALTDQMAAEMASAGVWVEKAFMQIHPSEKTALLKMFPRSLDLVLCGDTLSDWDAAMIIAAARKIQVAHLLKGFSVLSNLLSKDFLNRIRTAAAAAPAIPLNRHRYGGLEGRFLMIRETPIGLILIGDKGPNVYGMDAALIVDLGGDDIYMNNAGAPVYEVQHKRVFRIRHPAAVVIDFEGDDRYINQGFGAVASGFFGLGLILDMEGNDFYDGGQLSLGASFFGLGCLLDMKGNDTYVCSEGGQGCGFFGAAQLFDGQGDDLYLCAKYAQGFGGALGLGVLYDVKGEDHYRAGWKHGSSYGTKGVFQGRSQGVGWGFRKHTGGGIGILLDSAGNDVYEAGNFSQGAGYFLGLGMLRDDGGNDVYRGSRYCQGTAAHRAAGALLDFSGDDRYFGKIAANQGAAWDLSVACLVDYEGDDHYRGADLSLGAGAQNGMGLFFDGEGNDRYVGPTRSLGFSGDLSYGGGRGAGNLGVFMDVGGGEDVFTVKGKRNNLFSVTGNLGVFLDE